MIGGENGLSTLEIVALRLSCLAVRLMAVFLASSAIAAPVSGPIFETEVGCSKARDLGSETCRRAFASARREFEAKTRSYASREACYVAFGPCMPWPLHTVMPTHFRPQLMGVSLSGSGLDGVATPVIAQGKIKIAFTPRQLSSEAMASAYPQFTIGSPQPLQRVANLDALCGIIGAAAARESLPAAFLTRLLWTESSFRSEVVSPAGAQGIAQFMPETAQERGLDDPFDPEKAIRKSASLLSDLRRRFGNLGLAAAAYNGGPARVSGWLQGDRSLSDETRKYVVSITGRSVDEWAADGKEREAEAFPKTFSCP